MEKDDKGSTMIRMGVSGWMFLLVPAYPGCPGSKAVKRSLLLLLLFFSCYLSHPVLLLSWSRIVPFFPQSFAKLWVTVHDVKWHYNSSRWMSLFADRFWYSLGQAGAAGSGDGEVTCPGEVSPGAGPRAPFPGTVHQSNTEDFKYWTELYEVSSLVICHVFRSGGCS